MPGVGILPTTSLGVRFSEAMDTESVNAFDSMQVTRVDPTTTTLTSFDFIVGTVTETTDLRTFSVTPTLPLLHELGMSEEYFLTVSADQTDSVTDLAGNRLLESPASGVTGPLVATINPDAVGSVTGGRISRFSAADEEPPFASDEDDPYVEWSGQIVYNTTTGSIRPRPVVRSEGLADRTNIFVSNGNNIANPTGVIDPLSRFGSKTQMVWRYADVGIEMIDSQTGLLSRDFLNIDIEGMNWAPFGGQVNVDTYSQFEMRMSHASWLPDEILVGIPPLPAFPDSGLINIFQSNQLDEGTDPQAVVHDRNLGYIVNPGDIYISGEGTRLIPFPLNEGTNPNEFRYFTWRDTSVNRRAAPNGFGARMAIDYFWSPEPFPIGENMDMMCDPLVPVPPFFTPNEVKTAGLPLLVEFRCFPDDAASSTNSFDTSLALTVSTQPFFRAFSAGGNDTSQVVIRVDPDLEDMANGGFNPNSTPTAGAPTSGLDNNIYLGSLDFVVRVSRAYSVWWPIEENLNQMFPSSEFFPPVIEPAPSEQPVNTSLEFAYRGAFSLPAIGDQDVTDAGFAIRSVATEMDPYGDFYGDASMEDPCENQNVIPAFNHNSGGANVGIAFLSGPGNNWQDDVASINGANFYQVRVTFISNPQTGLVPSLSSFAMNWANDD